MTSAGRDTVTIFTGYGGWTQVAKALNERGVAVSPCTLIRRRASARRNFGGQGVPVSARQVAKVKLPSPVEQPNGHVLNFVNKEVEIFCARNAHIVTCINMDDHAAIRYDLVYRRSTLIQKRMQQKHYQSAGPKAQTKDQITESGYQHVLTSHLALCQSTLALENERAKVTGEEAWSIEWDGEYQGDVPRRDGQLRVVCKSQKLQRSTAAEHGRNLLHYLLTDPAFKFKGRRGDGKRAALKPILFKMVDGGADMNPTFWLNIMVDGLLMMRLESQLLLSCCRASSFNIYAPVERANAAVTGAIANTMTPSDTWGKPALGSDGAPKTPEDGKLERRNLDTCTQMMVEVLDGNLSGATCFRRPIISMSCPLRGEMEGTSKDIDDQRMEEWRKQQGGCGCLSGCADGRCRSCRSAGRPCSFRCKCKAKCSNDTAHPDPAYLDDHADARLLEVVENLTPAELELWCTRHMRVSRYSHQFVLCGDSASESCWYCSRYFAKYQRVKGLDWFPFMTKPCGGGGYVKLQQRAADLAAGGTREVAETDYLTDAHLPSAVLGAAFGGVEGVERGTLVEEMVQKTNLSAGTVEGHFAKLQRKVEAAQRVADH